MHRADTSYSRALRQSDTDGHSYCYSDRNCHSHTDGNINPYGYSHSPAHPNAKI